MRLKYHYSVISVIVDSLPGNTKNRESTRSWLIGVRLFNPCAGSATDSDFPRPVRSVKRSRFAATVFARSKPVNWGRSLPKILVFLTEKTKTDALHILVRSSNTLIGSYMSAIMYAPGHHWPNMSKTQPLDLDSSSWFKWEDRGGVVIWWKTYWHVFLRGQLREIFVRKPRPFREIPLLRKGRC